MKHLFLDTNVIIDVLANRQPYAGAASKLLSLGERGKLTIYISALSYSNIYYILRKICGHKEMIALLRDLKSITTTMSITQEIIHEAIESGMKDFEDAIQLNTAISNKKIQAIVTRDVKGFKDAGLAVLTPEEALRLVEGIN